MSKTLVLAEKPSVARDLARVLKCSQKGSGFFEGSKYIVTWALGHLVTLAEPEVYHAKYKSWRIEDLPIMPEHLKTVVIKQTGRQFNAVKTQLSRKDVREIVIATDAGREGELVARWIIEKASIKKPIKRLWISSVTDKAIKEGFNKLRDGRDYLPLYASAVARAEADWYVGINATRALTCRFNAQLSCGRVQTPTLAIIARREEEIKNFQPQPYYGITAAAENLKLVWQNSSGDSRIFDQQKCSALLQKLKNQPAHIIEVDNKAKKKLPPQLYDLTELQRDANKLYGFSAKKTLSIMQRLYEQHKLLTYPRTDSRYLSADITDTLPERIQACGVQHRQRLAAKILRSPIKPGRHFVDDSKVSDHHAIIPTEQPVFLDALSSEERKIYDLVVDRFFAVLLPPFEYRQITVKAKIGEEIFTAKGRTIVKQGWKEVYDFDLDDEDTGEEQVLPDVKKGDTLRVLTLTQTCGETKPPTRFNEGTLLSAMENPAKYMPGEDKELIKTLGKTGGLGTVATRADIIEKLFDSFLIEKRGREIFLTSKGKQLLELVPAELKSPALTAQWEQKLEQIAKGRLTKNAFIKEIKAYTIQVVNEIKNSDKKFKHDNVTGSRCPQCGKYLLEVQGKKGKMLICQDRSCGYRKSTAKITNARCPQCHKRLELHGEGEGQIFICKCGYREKLSAFNARKKNEKAHISKKEVSKYLKQQNKEADNFTNPALAEALAKLKLK